MTWQASRDYAAEMGGRLLTLDEARALTKFEERKPLYDKVQEILYNEGPDVVPYFKNYVSANRKEVKNYKLIPVQYVDLRDTWVER